MTRNMPPLVSALVSTYRAERFMRSLLTDLTSQTLAGQLEIVIVDSHSPEDEARIVAEFQTWFPRIVFERSPCQQPLYVTLNRCLALARGKYVTLANTDDRHLPDAYERMAALLEARPDVALVYADVAVTKNEGDLLANRRLEDAEITAYYRWPEFHPVSFFQQCYAGPQPMWRRALHERHGGFDPEFIAAGDYEFWLRLIARGETFLHLPDVLGLMLHTSASVSHGSRALLESESRRCRERYWPVQMGSLPPAQGSYLQLPDVYRQARPEAYPTQEPVTVVLSVDGHPEWLTETLATVIGQRYPRLELVVLNASGENLFPLLAAIPGLPPTRLLTAPDPVLRNLGLRLAEGAAVLFLRCGDRWHGAHLLRHLQALQTHEWVYSDAYRLPYRRTSAHLERLARDTSNSADLDLAHLLGQFVADVSLSLRTALLRRLPYDGQRPASPAAATRWRQLAALRQGDFFGRQIARSASWDLQLLALEQAHGHRLRQITCEYVAEVEPTAAGPSLEERLKASCAALATPPALPAPARLAVLLQRVDAGMAPLPPDVQLIVIETETPAQLALPELRRLCLWHTALDARARLRLGLKLCDAERLLWQLDAGAELNDGLLERLETRLQAPPADCRIWDAAGALLGRVVGSDRRFDFEEPGVAWAEASPAWFAAWLG